jgi:hypothetical protein
MKHAATMKYGGELVAAEDCTYDTYTVIEIITHDEGTPYECQSARLQPPPPATHTAHWPIEQLELISEATA